MSYDPEDSKCCFRGFGIEVNRKNLKWTTCGILTGISLLLMIILLVVSRNTVDQKDYAIAYDANTASLGGEVLEEGTHLLTPETQLITVPRTFVTVQTEYKCLSKDGLPISFTPSAQFQYLKRGLRQSILNIGDGNALGKYIDDKIETAVRDVCGNYTGQQFFSNRQDVENDFNDYFNGLLSTDQLVNVVGGSNQLRNFDLPIPLLDAINKGQAALEDVATALIQRPERLIIAQTDAATAAESNQILLANARATAASTRFAGQTVANSRTILWTQVLLAMQNGITNLGLDSDSYIDYLLTKASVDNLSSEQRSCLRNCEAQSGASSNHCWYCWIDGNISPSVSV